MAHSGTMTKEMMAPTRNTITLVFISEGLDIIITLSLQVCANLTASLDRGNFIALNNGNYWLHTPL